MTTRITEAEMLDLARMPNLPADDGSAFFNPPEGMARGITYERAREFVNFMIANAFGEQPPAIVLDFGCGWGIASRVLSRAPRTRYVERHGCDTDVTALDAARRSDPGFWVQPVGTLPPSIYRDAMFDVVFSASAFARLPDEAALAWAGELARILAPTGRLVLSAGVEAARPQSWFERTLEPRGFELILWEGVGASARCVLALNQG